MPAVHLLIFGSVMTAAWFLTIYFWPRLMLGVYQWGILVQGAGAGPIPVNTLYTAPPALFADPLHAPASASKLMTTGVNHDTLMSVGWLELGRGAQVVQVPDFAGRYYSLQFTNPAQNTTFAYIGTRATGTQAGGFLITGPGWQGAVPHGLTQIASPTNAVLLIGRTLVYSDSDLATAYALSRQIRLTPFNG